MYKNQLLGIYYVNKVNNAMSGKHVLLKKQFEKHKSNNDNNPLVNLNYIHKSVNI